MATAKPIEEYMIDNGKLRERIQSLEELLEREHELKEMYKHAWIEEISRLAAWSRVWKRACKVWRHRAKNEQKMVNERDIELSDLRVQLANWQIAYGPSLVQSAAETFQEYQSARKPYCSCGETPCTCPF